ncbi:MAG: arginine deiminase family protein, partial [Planctomycetota bacterium]
GEHDAVEAVLADFKQIERIESPGVLDGGDVLRMDDHFVIGLSARTDQAGAEQLAAILTRCGYSASTVPVEGVLHLKTGITQAADGLLVAAPEFAKHTAFAAFDVLEVAPGEDYCANCLLVNGRLIMPSGFSQTFAILQARGIAPLTVDMSEFRKMDGGLTCLSLLW